MINPARSRVLKSALRTLTLLGFMAAATIPTVHASSLNSVVCAGTNHDTYDPGVTLQPRSVHAHWQDTYSCTSTDPTLTAGSDSPEATLQLSCLQPFLDPGTMVVNWNNGRSSTFTLTFNPNVSVGGQNINVGAGTVTAGEFTGDAVTVQYVDAQLDPVQCLTSQGVTSQSGTSSIVITGS